MAAQVVKRMWVYIKEKGLQNPADKRELLLDAKMKVINPLSTISSHLSASTFIVCCSIDCEAFLCLTVRFLILNVSGCV